MTGDAHNMHSIKSQVEKGQYRVDPPAIADAIIRWFANRTHARREVLQNEWSNPVSGPGASRNSTLDGPSTTEPIQVNPLFDGRSL